VRTWLPTI
jgi:SWI/SNF-related matrix-associated actin-dependent regulator of chromatin subfamily A-like protein 1